MWESEADWDDLVEESLVNKARQWYEELSALPCLLVPRCLRAETTVRGIVLYCIVFIALKLSRRFIARITFKIVRILKIISCLTFWNV